MTGTRLNWTVSREYVSPSCWHARPCETFVTIIDNHWLHKCDSKVTIFIIRIICHRNLSCQSARYHGPPTLPGRFMKPVEQGNQGTNRSKAEEKRTQKQRNKTKKQQIYIYIYIILWQLERIHIRCMQNILTILNIIDEMWGCFALLEKPWKAFKLCKLFVHSFNPQWNLATIWVTSASLQKVIS